MRRDRLQELDSVSVSIRHGKCEERILDRCRDIGRILVSFREIGRMLDRYGEIRRTLVILIRCWMNLGKVVRV